MTKDEVKALLANGLSGREARALAKKAQKDARAAARGLKPTRAVHAVTDDDGVMVVVEHTPKPRRPSDAAGTWRGKHG